MPMHPVLAGPASESHSATANGFDAQLYPQTIFAAVRGIQYGLARADRQPLSIHKSGGVLLSELSTGVFAIVVVCSAYDRTVDTVLISSSLEIIPDNASCSVVHRSQALTGQQVHNVISFSLPVADGQRRWWTHLRFYDRRVYARFSRHVWAAYDVVTAGEATIQERLDQVAYASPSNFTHYCRQYLGADYFDNLSEDSYAGSEDGDEDKDEEMRSPANDGGFDVDEGSSSGQAVAEMADGNGELIVDD
ncbi:hypothetical protein C8T65DRAFT_745539 [Cerioporus squamosus]|nr:hypothetical protein C8T65DRAFT_745539 [Cerioporus squamosus]